MKSEGYNLVLRFTFLCVLQSYRNAILINLTFDIK